MTVNAGPAALTNELTPEAMPSGVQS